MLPASDNKIGVFGAISYTAGTIIGSGIFVSPKGILEHAGSIGLSLLIWVTCAIIASLSGLIYVELATSIPESGSDFAYLNYAKWKPLAFAFLWLSNFIEASCSCGILMYTFGEYIVEALDPLKLDLSDYAKRRIEQFAGFALIWLLTWANFFSLKKYASKIQIFITIMKLLSVSIIIVTGFYFLIFKGKNEHFKTGMWNGTETNAGKIILAVYSGIWAYGGYDTLNYGTEDVDPTQLKKILPISVVGGLGIATVVYLLANIAYFTILTPQQILDATAVATDFARDTLGNVYYAMPAIVALLMIGTLNSDLFSWSRFVVSGARAGMMPKFLALIHVENDSPRTGLLFHVLASMAFSFVGPIDTLMGYMIVTGMLRQSATVSALIYIRLRKIPVSKTAIKFPLILHFTVLSISLALIIIPATQDPLATSIGIGMFLVFLAAYFAIMWPNYDWSFMHRIDDAITIFCQKLFMSVIDETPRIEIETE